MAQFEKWFTQDLTKDVPDRHCESVTFTGDNLANVIGVNLFVNGEPYSGGGTVAGTVIRADGITVPVNGTLDGNSASITLTDHCLAVPGIITVNMKLIDTTERATILHASFTAVMTETGTAVDPEEIIPDLATLQAAADEATAAAADARAAASSAVRYDTAQSLTDAQQKQARDNIAAASLIPDGTAFSKAIQGGTTYDVQDARTDTVMDVLSLVDYGLGVKRELSPLPGSTLSTASASFDNGVFVLTGGTAKNSTTGKVFVDCGRQIVTAMVGSVPAASVQGMTLVDGHTYRVRMEHISGSYSGDNTYVNPAFFKPGSVSPKGTDGVLVYDASTYDHGIFAGVSIGRNNNSDGITFSEGGYKFRLIVEDITDIGDKNIAPIDTPTATSTHQPGDLLTVGGTLYKATQAIAPGDTIAAGTNVTETTVAAQLAERDTAISGRAKSGAIAGSLSNNPSVGDLVMDSTGDLYVVDAVDTPNVGDVSLIPTTVAEQLAERDTAIAGLPMSAGAYFAAQLAASGTITINGKVVTVSGNHVEMHGTGASGSSTFAMFNVLGTLGGVNNAYSEARVKSLFTSGYCYTADGSIFPPNRTGLLRVASVKLSAVTPPNAWEFGIGLYTYNATTDTLTAGYHGYTYSTFMNNSANCPLAFEVSLSAEFIEAVRTNNNLALVVYGKTGAQYASSSLDLYWEIVPVALTT